MVLPKLHTARPSCTGVY